MSKIQQISSKTGLSRKVVALLILEERRQLGYSDISLASHNLLLVIAE